MSLQLEIRRVGEIVFVKCTGRIVHGEESQRLQKTVTELIGTDRQIVLHLGEITFVDSSGLGLLVRLAGVARSARGDLKLCSVPPDIAHLLKITNLRRVLETYESEMAAVTAFYEGVRRSDAMRAGGPKVICFGESEDVLALVRELARQLGYAPITTCNLLDARVLIKATNPALIVIAPGISEENRRALQAGITKTPVAVLDSEFAHLAPAEASEHVAATFKAALGKN